MFGIARVKGIEIGLKQNVLFKRYIRWILSHMIYPRYFDITRVVSRANYFQKTVGCPKLEALKSGHEIFKITK